MLSNDKCHMITTAGQSRGPITPAQSYNSRDSMTLIKHRSHRVYHWRQIVVPAERTTAQPGQVWSSDRWNHQSAVCGDVIRVICVRGRSRLASSRWYQSARSLAWSASVISQARLGGGAIVQLPCTGHPTHSTPAYYGTGTDTGL